MKNHNKIHRIIIIIDVINMYLKGLVAQLSISVVSALGKRCYCCCCCFVPVFSVVSARDRRRCCCCVVSSKLNCTVVAPSLVQSVRQCVYGVVGLIRDLQLNQVQCICCVSGHVASERSAFAV